MLTNKWVLFGLSSASAVIAYLGTVDWGTLLPSKAGAIIMAIGAVKAVLTALLPSSTQPTNNKLFQLNK